METDGNDDGTAGELAAIVTRKEQLLGFRAQARVELAESPAIYEQLRLKQELKQLENAIREISIKEFELKGKIQRAAAVPLKCPTCGRHIPQGMVLTSTLQAALKGAGLLH